MNEDFFPLTDEYDHAIVMHRNAHFGGSFTLMMEYYKHEGKGAMPEFEMPRIRTLAALELENPGALDEMLSPDEVAEVERSKSLYEKLRNVYEGGQPDTAINSIVKAVADLILSEEEEPIKEIEALAALGKDAVDPLIALISSEDYYNPLFPGYGYAPAGAALALGKIGDPKAITPLFQALGREDFFTDASINDALGMLGEASKMFLLGRLAHEPLTKENTQAAIALAAFKEDPKVAEASLNLLEKVASDPKHTDLSVYLVYNCNPTQKERLQVLAGLPSLPSIVREELRINFKI